MNSDQTRQQAEQTFRREESAWDGRRALPEYEARALAIREKTARLKALRLAAEAQAQTENPVERPAKPTKRRPARREK